jgi:hypothetical protein
MEVKSFSAWSGGGYSKNYKKHGLISFTHGFNRVTDWPFLISNRFNGFRFPGTSCQYHLHKRVGSCFVEVSPDGLTHPLTQVVLTNQAGPLITRLKPGVNERECLCFDGRST